MANIYLDTNIYLDYWFNRSDNLRPLGEFAYALIKRAIQCEFFIYYSKSIINELCNVYNIDSDECYKRFFSDLDVVSKLISVEITTDIIHEAINKSKKLNIPREDALHALICMNNDLILVTRDKHFEVFTKDITVLKPEEL